LAQLLEKGRTLNVPKATVEAALEKATSKDQKELFQILFEGYGPKVFFRKILFFLFNCFTFEINNSF